MITSKTILQKFANQTNGNLSHLIGLSNLALKFKSNKKLTHKEEENEKRKESKFYGDFISN